MIPPEEITFAYKLTGPLLAKLGTKTDYCTAEELRQELPQLTKDEFEAALLALCICECISIDYTAARGKHIFVAFRYWRAIEVNYHIPFKLSMSVSKAVAFFHENPALFTVAFRFLLDPEAGREIERQLFKFD